MTLLVFVLYRVAQKNGTVDTVDFQDFALIKSYFCHLAG